MITMNRRTFLQNTLATASVGIFSPSVISAAVNDPDNNRIIKLSNQNTNEKLKVTFWRNNWFDQDAFDEIEHFFRDWREDATHKIDPYLIDLLYKISEKTGGDKELILLSGYRTPKTNQWLANHPKYRAAKDSLHLYGRAVDFTVPNKRLSTASKHARSFQVGGVGYYPSRHFIHVDTGKQRYWRS